MTDSTPSIARALATCELVGFVTAQAAATPGRGSVAKAGTSKSGTSKSGTSKVGYSKTGSSKISGAVF